MEEVWKPVVGYEGLYEVSNLGRVKSLERIDKMNRLRKGVILAPIIRKDRYKKVALSNNGVAKKVYIHRIMMEAFVPNPNNYPYINHKDENPSNNFIFINTDGTVDPQKSNLEWCTPEYNNNYGTIKERVSKKHSKTVVQKSLSGEFVRKYESLQEAAKTVGVTAGRISACCLNRQRAKTAGGFIWEYA